MAYKILVTGFEPFGGQSTNPSWDVARKLPARIGDVMIARAQIPTVFMTSAAVLADAIDDAKPAAVLMLGQAGGRSALTPERVAINIDDCASLADNVGDLPVDRAIAKRGPAAYFSTLPIKAMVAAMRAQGVPAAISNSAGTFVCNHLMYAALHHIHKKKLAIRAGFMHVPFLPSQVTDHPEMPSMALDEMLAGVCASAVAIATHQQDIALGADRPH
jgi:pyroglutamyl-peptidase